MRVPITNLCPQCKEVKAVNRLHRDIPKLSEAVYCVDPNTSKMLHAFASLDAALAYEPGLGFLDSTEPTENAALTESPAEAPTPPVEAPIAKAPTPETPAPKAALDPLPAELPKPRTAEPVAEDGHDAAIANYVAKKDAPIAPKTPEIPQIGPEPKKKFVPPPHLKRAGGVIVLTVQIPDQHVSPMCAEAENQKEKVESYFQRMVEYGLDARWFY